MISSKLFVLAAASILLAFVHPAWAQAAGSATVKPAVKAAQVTGATAARPAGIRAEPIPPLVDETFKRWDANHDGSLSPQEFRNGWSAMRRARGIQAGLRQQFDSVDANKNKAIDAGEYGQLVLIQKAGKSAPPLSAFDTNKNQRLEFPEYVDLVRKLAERPASSPAGAAQSTAPAP